MFYVNPEKCVGCGDCVENCPEEKAITLKGEGDDKKAVIDPEECIECGTCQAICPEEAIDERDE